MEEKKIAVISGGTSGIGLAAAEALAADGWTPVLLGRSAERGREAEARVPGSRFIACDVGRSADCEAALRAAAGMGRVAGAVAAAGLYVEGLLENTTDEEMEACFRTNVFGLMYFLRACVPHMKRGGSIVTVASDAALQGNVQCSVYGASKGAAAAFSRSLALELAVYGVRVNCVCPGDVKTPLLERQIAAYGGSEAEMGAQYPLGRIGRPEEIGALIAFLLSEKASFMTGSVIPADGGLTDW